MAESLAAHPAVSAAEMSKVSEQLAGLLRGIGHDRRRADNLNRLRGALVATGVLWFGLGLACLITPILSGGGLMMWVVGIVVVVRNGSKATRARLAWRALVAMAPSLAVYPALLFALRLHFFWPVFCAALIVLATELVWAVAVPDRGLQDRLAATYLVPR